MSKKSLPLEAEVHVEVDPASGTTIRRTVYKRGMLQTEVVRYENLFAALAAIAKKDPRNNFEALLKRARAVLRDAQLPTDEDTGEVPLPDGRVFRPIGQAKVQDLAAGFTFKDWSKIVEEETELLSPERSAMAVIKAVNGILQKNLDQEVLKYIWNLTQAMHRWDMFALGINEAAVTGREAKKALKKGSQARADEGKRKKAIVQKVASAHWKRVPLHRGKLAPTADAIKDELNGHVEIEGLRSIGRSQIIGYLREIIRDSAEQGRR